LLVVMLESLCLMIFLKSLKVNNFSIIFYLLPYSIYQIGL
jgi:hypothetical protein